MLWGTPVFGNVTALEGLHVTGKYREKHDAHMLQRLGTQSCTGVPRSKKNAHSPGRLPLGP